MVIKKEVVGIMALLNLDKFKKEGGGAKQDIPDELPSLPDASADAPTAAAAAVAPAGENNEQSQVPDELPPVSLKPRKPAEPTSLVKKPEAKIYEQKTDEKLYFSELMSRFHDKGLQRDVEKEFLSSSSGELVANLHAQWEEQKHKESMDEFEEIIIEKMKPLQNLEQEWRALKREIDQKNRNLMKKEEEIKALASELRLLLQEKNRLKLQAEHKSSG